MLYAIKGYHLFFFSFIRITNSWQGHCNSIKVVGDLDPCWPPHPINPLSPNIHIQILQTDLHTFPLRIRWENLIEHQGIFSFLIIFFIFSQPYLLTMYGHCWEKIAVGHYWDLKGLMRKRV